MTSLAESLGVGDADMVSFVGAGGKSTLLLDLGAELAAARKRLVMTTTTKMGADQIPAWAVLCSDESEVAAALQGGTAAFLVGEVADGKIVGVAPEVADRVFGRGDVDYVLVEADGARRRSIKAPADHEPVIPATATLVVAVAGMDAVDRPISAAAHRPALVAALLERDLDDPVRPRDVARLLSDPRGGRKSAPQAARLTAALTNPGSEAASAAASRVAVLLEDSAFDRVTIIDMPPDPSRGSG